MHFDFYIDNIKLSFSKHGTADVRLCLNGHDVDTTIDGSLLKDNDNILEIFFTKKDPADTDSYARLTGFNVNDGDFLQKIKKLPYSIDNTAHPEAPVEIANNLYFGYKGKLVITFSHRCDKLAEAAWLIADNEFEPVKWPLKGQNYRHKTFNTVYRDARYMFTGSLAPNTPEINSQINSMQIGDLRMPLKTDKDRSRIQNWINESSRIKFTNFESLPHFTYSNGILDSLNSFIMSSARIYMPEKMYYFHGEVLHDKSIELKDLFRDELLPGSEVLIELPSPWYDTHALLDKIKEAKNKDCRVALDLTWMPTSMDPIQLDLESVDQIFLSMNKTWPIHDVRPAFRWSKQRINDSQTFQYEFCSYPKVGANVFMRLLDMFPFDYAYDKYHVPAEQIRHTFELEPTSVLWFTKSDHYKHDPEEHISKYYHLDDFVCLRKLLDFKDKYFW